jgi:hypothetical protein
LLDNATSGTLLFPSQQRRKVVFDCQANGIGEC